MLAPAMTRHDVIERQSCRARPQSAGVIVPDEDFLRVIFTTGADASRGGRGSPTAREREALLVTSDVLFDDARLLWQQDDRRRKLHTLSG